MLRSPPDIYGKGVRPATPQQAMQESSKYGKDRPLMRQRVQAGLEQLKSNPDVDPNRIAAIGYCFGGTVALELGFEDEMRATKVDWQFVSYGGAVHGFSNPHNNDPEHGLVYDKRADQRSWKAMQDFFNETFAK